MLAMLASATAVFSQHLKATDITMGGEKRSKFPQLYRQSTAPSGTLHECDIWINTATDSVTTYVWDGSAWKLNGIRAASGSGSSGVASFNGRTSAVVPASGDYSAAQITNSPSGTIAATTAQAAINELATEKLQDATDAVDADNLATNSVGASEIAADAVGSSEIATDAVGMGEISTGAVGTDEIATDGVDAAEIAANAVSSSEIAANAVGNSEMADDAITSAEIADNAVGSSEIATGSVTTAEILDATVAWGDLSQPVKDSISANDGGAAQSIAALSAISYRDSLNLNNSLSINGATISSIGEKIVHREALSRVVRKDAENRLQKTLLQPAGLLTNQNGRFEWDLSNRTTARINLTLPSNKMLSPINAQAGGVYSLVVSQDATGGRVLFFDQSAWKINGSINTSPYAVTTLLCTCSDGRTVSCSVSSTAPSANQSALTTLKDAIVFAIMPSELGNSWVEGISQNPKYRPANYQGALVGSYVDQGPNSWDIAAFNSNPGDSEKWTVESNGGYQAFKTTSTNSKFRNARSYTSIHSNTFTLYGWVRTNNNTSQQAFCAAGSSASHRGFRWYKNSSSNVNFTIWDGTGVERFNHTNTGTALNIAAGWTRVYVRSSSDADSIYITVGTTTTGAAYSATSIADLSHDITVWYDQTSGASWNGWGGNIMAFNRPLTNSEIALLDALPQSSITQTNGGYIYPTNTAFSMEKIAGWSFSFSARDSIGMYTDASASSPVSGYNQDVYICESRHRGGADKRFTTDNTARRPQFKSGVLNNESGLYFDSLDLMSFTTLSSLGKLCGTGTIFFVMSADTNQQRTLFHDNSNTRLRISTPKLVTGGGGRVHQGQSHARLEQTTTGAFHTGYGGISSKLPSPGSVVVGWVTWSDSLYEMAINNSNYVKGTLNAATFANDFFQCGGSSSYSFKGTLGEFWKNQNALSATLRDSAAYYLAGLYNIPNVPQRTNLTPDSERTPIFTPDWWMPGQEETDYRAFGEIEPVVMPDGDTCILVSEKWNKHHIRRANANGAVVMTLYNLDGTVRDTITVARDNMSQKLDCYGGHFSMKNDSIAYVALTYVGDAYDPNWALGTDTIIPFYRTVNIWTGALGALTEINITNYSAITSWFFGFDFEFGGADSVFLVGYGNQNFGGEYDLLHAMSTNGGTSWTLLKSWEGNSYSPDLKPEEPHYLRMPNDSVGIVFRNDENDLGIFWTSTTSFTSSSWSTPTKWFTGLSFAKPCLTPDRDLVFVQRGDFTTYPTYVWISHDFGATWENSYQLDVFRHDAHGIENMYGNAFVLGLDLCAGWWGADREQGGDFCTFSWQKINFVQN